MADDDATPSAPRRRRRTRTGPGATPGGEPDSRNGGPAQRGPGAGSPMVDEDGTSLQADHVELRLSAIGRVEAGEVELTQGALGATRAERVWVTQGAIGAAMADQVAVSQGYARSILARDVQLEQAGARFVVAGDVRADRSFILFLVARHVEGQVRVLFDWRGALAVGAVAGLLVALLGRRRPRAS